MPDRARASRCKWEWLGDQWGILQECDHPAESCGEPAYRGSMIGEIAFTDCSS